MKSNSSKIAIAIIVPIVVVAILAAVATFIIYKLKRRPENRQFTYKDLELITHNFQQEIGRGGFGKVYSGFMVDGTQIAVKLRLQTSTQGIKEFMVEAHLMTRIHHKNLVSLIGYCKDENSLALVLEYMSEGNLDDHLRDAKMEAKTADFGISKAFNSTNSTHVSMNHIVTGQPAIIKGSRPDNENMNIIQWVCQRLAKGNIESVVDARMQGEYDINSVWKAADVALKCTAQSAVQRPTMTEVVIQLKECIELEAATGRNYNTNFYSGNNSNGHTIENVSQNSTQEMEQKVGRVPVASSPVAR
ncbi:leucine-rich repeat receptor-like serine/threonine-protein kinase [Carex littledalei]|uniref:Leucine-rich repeat receptor-like serine/threonine-protein kinase n=1 Tax=Carex littledalei TaxID=544730 RepID=A0A833RCD5_9POAL|nr:leucine-rich repeat receptor-like serine/threonine-protein kinase [Carex littledalei]